MQTSWIPALQQIYMRKNTLLDWAYDKHMVCYTSWMKPANLSPKLFVLYWVKLSSHRDFNVDKGSCLNLFKMEGWIHSQNPLRGRQTWYTVCLHALTLPSQVTQRKFLCFHLCCISSIRCLQAERLYFRCSHSLYLIDVRTRFSLASS